METKKYITILDFEKSKVFQYELNEREYEEAELVGEPCIVFDKHNHRDSNCEWMIHDEPGFFLDIKGWFAEAIFTKFKSEIKEEIKTSEQHQEEMEKRNLENDFSEYEKGYQAGLTFAQGVVDKVFTKKRNHG